MKSFLELIEEDASGEKHHVMTFGRMNPPTTGHLKLIDKVKSVAQKNNADHTVVVSHTQDSKKNPLSAEQKLKHLKRYSPGTNLKSSSKEHPSFLHHAAELHKKGVTHLHLVVGSDRVKEMKDTLHRYNGTHPGALFNFKKITVHSAGQRDPDAEGTEGMSASKMREHAKNNDSHAFRQGVPPHVSDTHSNELMHDVRKGMGLHEELYRGHFKAIFLTGGPGSGKDIIIREAIAESNICELNFIQVKECLSDKQKLSEKSNNHRRESIRNRGPLIINGPADDFESINYIKEELEELGYETMMVFVSTTNETSKERNSLLTRMMTESIRQDKWTTSRNNIKNFNEAFDTFITFDNTGDVNSKEEDINYVYQHTTAFLDSVTINETSGNWFIRNNKLLEERKNVKKNSKLIQQSNRKTKDQTAGCNCPKVNHRMFKLNDNNCPYCQINRKSGTIDSVKDGDVASNGTYTFRTYAEQSQPTVKVNARPKEPNFQQDKDKIQKMKNRGWKNSPSGALKASGVSPEFDTRQQGTVYPMSGMGDVTYREQKQFKKFREAIDSPGEVAMGVSGVLNGATNKEPMVTPMDKFGMSGITIKKKKDKTK
jgi:ribosomal protein L17